MKIKKLVIWYLSKLIVNFEKEIDKINNINGIYIGNSTLAYLGSKSYYKDMIDTIKKVIEIIKQY